MRQKTCAGGVVRIVETAVTVASIGQPALIVLIVFRREKCAQMMIEPPGDLGRSGVFEVDNRVLVSNEISFIEERSGAVHKAMVLIAGILANALAMKTGKKRSRAGPIETLVVIENANVQTQLPWKIKWIRNPLGLPGVDVM